MLIGLDIQHFKAFGARQHLPLAPITLIFGENSSGKTSILQTLSLLKQTHESKESGAALLPRAEDGIVDLGSFSEFIFDHDSDKTLEIGLEVLPKESNRWQRIIRQSELLREGSLKIVFSFRRQKKSGEIVLSGFRLGHPRAEDPLVRFEPRILSDREQVRLSRLFYSPLRNKGGSRRRSTAASCVAVTSSPRVWEPIYKAWFSKRYEVAKTLMQHAGSELPRQVLLFEDEESLPQQNWRQQVEEAIAFFSSDFSLNGFIERGRARALGTIVSTDGFLPLSPVGFNPFELPEYIINETGRRGTIIGGLPTFEVAEMAGIAGSLVEETLTSLFPLGPFRSPPQRWYIFTGTSPIDVGHKGHHLPDLLFRQPDLVDKANQWLARLQIGYQIRLRNVGTEDSDLFEVRLLDTRRTTEVDVALSDVGFGLSQILPFIVQILASDSQLISIEQPEVHIHPRLQADLGDLIAAGIKEPYGHRFLIETHSEHLVLRLQRLVRTGILSPRDVSVLYVSRTSNGSSVERLNLDEFGDFVDEWPNGFFPERLRELR